MDDVERESKMRDMFRGRGDENESKADAVKMDYAVDARV